MAKLDIAVGLGLVAGMVALVKNGKGFEDPAPRITRRVNEICQMNASLGDQWNGHLTFPKGDIYITIGETGEVQATRYTFKAGEEENGFIREITDSDPFDGNPDTVTFFNGPTVNANVLSRENHHLAKGVMFYYLGSHSQPALREEGK